MIADTDGRRVVFLEFWLQVKCVSTAIPNPAMAKPVYRFGEFELRPESGELFRNGTPVRLQEQSLQVLLALLENPGGVVSRDQLRERLWPGGTYVDFEQSMNAAVKRLRAALGDDAEGPRYIETLPKRGYRLIVEVSQDSPATPDKTQTDSVSQVQKKSLSRVTMIAVALTLVVISGTAWFLRGRFRTGFSDAPPPPQNSEAYELYLRSLGYKLEYPANGQAIGLLERSAALDPNSARTWYELSKRYNIEFYNSARGRGFFQQARDANRRALELAPNFPAAEAQKVVLDVQSGQVVPAYHAARAMTRERPRDSYAHYALAYTLRHGGMFEEAASECDLAFKLDPTNTALRSCALLNVYLGRYDRVQAYLVLDLPPYLARFRRMELAVLRNDKAAALVEARAIPLGTDDYADARLMEAALSGASAETVKHWSRETEALDDRIDVPEQHFVDARYQSWAGQTEPALRLLRRAITNNFCGYPVMDTDPFLANVRKTPEYKEVRQAGINCRENFRAQMEK